MRELNPAARRIGELGIVLVVRAEKAGEELMRGIEAVRAGGVEAIEITFSVPGAVSVMESVRKSFGKDVLLGAGTVLRPSDVAAAVNAGAEFIVSPSTDFEVIEISKKLGAAVIPGAFTPTEVVSAWSAGADAVKIFPASVGGPDYIKALRGPLPHVRFVPTGGVGLDNIAEFFKSGAFAVAVGTRLLDKKMLAAGDCDGLTALASKFVAAVKQAKG